MSSSTTTPRQRKSLLARFRRKKADIPPEQTDPSVPQRPPVPLQGMIFHPLERLKHAWVVANSVDRMRLNKGVFYWIPRPIFAFGVREGCYGSYVRDPLTAYGKPYPETAEVWRPDTFALSTGVAWLVYSPANLFYAFPAMFGAYVTALLIGWECTNDGCCYFRAIVLTVFFSILTGLFLIRRPLLGDNLIPLAMLALFVGLHAFYIRVARDSTPYGGLDHDSERMIVGITLLTLFVGVFYSLCSLLMNLVAHIFKWYNKIDPSELSGDDAATAAPLAVAAPAPPAGARKASAPGGSLIRASPAPGAPRPLPPPPPLQISDDSDDGDDGFTPPPRKPGGKRQSEREPTRSVYSPFSVGASPSHADGDDQEGRFVHAGSAPADVDDDDLYETRFEG